MQRGRMLVCVIVGLLLIADADSAIRGKVQRKTLLSKGKDGDGKWKAKVGNDGRDGKDGTAKCDVQETIGFAFSLTFVEGFVLKPGAFIPANPCFYPVTLPALLAKGFVSYAWIPWSYMDNATLEVFPHGAYIYWRGPSGASNNNFFPAEGPHVLGKITRVPLDSPDAALIFGPGKLITDPYYMNFDDALMHRNASSAAVYIKEAIVCTRSLLSYDVTQPFVQYEEFAWRGKDDANSCGSFIYQRKDGCGIMAHDC
eukprot:gb/GEZN01009519.1/.p1 GENE.gb/GEZN01009519.1/~~gb/GEZN01009519.1/.p1  ORF type:complete len:256 (-),score=11.99 gb/GEZN01009519.1/:393-1160(-)